MKARPPRVSVVVAAHNAAQHIGEALSALSADTGTLHEVVLVDDGSTDTTAEIADALPLAVDVQVHRLPFNVGSAKARNIAVSHARGEYVAVADADDITLPNRLCTQVAFLDANPGVDVVGGQLLDIGDWGGPSRGWTYPTDPGEIQRRFRRGRMGLAHPTTMYRRSWFESLGGYDSQLRRCEDFDLFLRGRRGFNYAALPVPLIHYRRPQRQVSWAYWWREERYRRSVVDMHRSDSPQKRLNFDEVLERNSTMKTRAFVSLRYARAWLHESRW